MQRSAYVSGLIKGMSKRHAMEGRKVGRERRERRKH
jgi:hypothetical protein